MTSEPRDWQASPNALEFLPEEIAMLAAGTMVLCAECQWPRPAGGPRANCGTCNVDRTRDDNARHGAASPAAPR